MTLWDIFNHRSSPPSTRGIWIVVAVLVGLALPGCQTVPMTARSKLDVPGPVVAADTVIFLSIKGGDTTKTLEIRNKSATASAADLELKKHELDKRAEVGVEQARNKCFLSSCGAMYPGQYGGGYYGAGSMPIAPWQLSGGTQPGVSRPYCPPGYRCR